MTRVDFYILPDAGEHARHLFACRITEKAYMMGSRVFVHTPSAATARLLDELLWTFRQHSFVPHDLLPTEPTAIAAPVQIGAGQEPATEPQVLVNLSDQVPEFFGRFERLVETVDASPDSLRASRQRYRFYKERGYPLQTHRL